MKIPVALFLLLACGAAQAAKSPEPIEFRANVKLGIDAQGTVESAETLEEKLPAPIREYIERQAMTWRFVPPVKDGKPVSGVTYARVSACAIPAEAGIRLAMDYAGNGPRNPALEGGFLVPPQYPYAAVRAGKSAEAVVTYTVGADGRAEVNGIRYRGNSDEGHRYFDDAIRQWVRKMRPVPEQVAGEPVATMVEVPVDFWLGAKSRSAGKDGDVPRQTPACMAASGGKPALQPVAVNSPFRRADAG